MSSLLELKLCQSKRDLAHLLGVKTSTLTHSLYVRPLTEQYTTFEIAKKSGGQREITAPSDQLKYLQSQLSLKLQDCIEEINSSKKSGKQYKNRALSHGFVRGKSIYTNAVMHLNKRLVLNIDLKDYFDRFNFGRVRGFFIKNRNFELAPDIATVIAQIACFDNKLPQGSPSSPVITNLITHSLDIRLASLAKKHSCTYSRYADDITFSTRKEKFPREIIIEYRGKYKEGKRLVDLISNEGFSINRKKTRIQYKDSRQDVTGLVVNQKPSIKSEYHREARAKCNHLFKHGYFYEFDNGTKEISNTYKLEGQLNFIDYIDHLNRKREHKILSPDYRHSRNSKKTKHHHNSRERTFAQFLFYKHFYNNDKPTIICEGETDPIYLKCAIKSLCSKHKLLASKATSTKDYELLVSFLKYTERTRFLLELFGGTDYMYFFIKSYDADFQRYSAPKPENPVIMVLDNDKGLTASNNIIAALKKFKTLSAFPSSIGKGSLRDADFIHLIHNLYIIFTPRDSAKDSDIESLFDTKTKEIKVNNKSFNPNPNHDNELEYGKSVFATKVVKAQSAKIDFSGFTPLLDRIEMAIEHYSKLPS